MAVAPGVAEGDHVALIWGEEGVVGVAAASPAPPPVTDNTLPPPDVIDPGEVLTIDARPDSARTWTDNGWADDSRGSVRAIQGEGRIGLFEFGQGLLTADGMCVAARLRLTRVAPLGDDAAQIQIGGWDGTVPPALTPITSATITRGESALVELGAEVGQAMLDGHIVGVGVDGDDLAALAGPHDDPLSGQLRIDYIRS